jgi:hypothetical protein
MGQYITCLQTTIMNWSMTSTVSFCCLVATLFSAIDAARQGLAPVESQRSNSACSKVTID